MAYRIVFLDTSTLGEVNLSPLDKLGEYKEFDYTDSIDTIERIGNHHIVVTNKVVIDQSVMDACNNLKLICVAATGMNNVDLSYAAHKGITVKNVAGYSTESVAQFTFAMLFHLLHNLTYYDYFVKSGQYEVSRIFTHHKFPFFELKGRKYGIIGLGNIGNRVAELAGSFGMKVVYYSTSGKNDNKYYQRVSLNELLTDSDIISIHSPLNDQTLNLIGEDQFRLMKPNSVIINVGRGGIINESALAKAIDNKMLAAAAVDVLSKEPISQDNPLLKIKNKERLLITPHIAWASIESRTLLVEKIAENIQEFIVHNPGH